MSARPYFSLLAAMTAVGLVGCSVRALTPQAPGFAPRLYRTYHASSTAGIVIPLYVYPGKAWNAVVKTKLAHSYVPFIVIANVHNGPGTTADPKYVAAIEQAQKAGIYVLGYVYTKYGKRSTALVYGDIARWEALYRTDGIFLDEMASNAPSYYQAATKYAHENYLWLVMGNPGVDSPGSSGPDVINFYERGGYPKLSFLRKPAHRSFGSGKWSYIAGGVPFNPAKIKATTQYVGYLYATNGKEPECYCKLPSYFTSLVALLDPR